MRPAVLALSAAALAALACSPDDSPSCPGTPVANFTLEGTLVSAGVTWSDPSTPEDPLVVALDPVPKLLDCTPDPHDAAAPIRYPPELTPFEARLAADPITSAAALCRPTGIVYSGVRTGAASYTVEADADAAILCTVCVAKLQVIVSGDVVPGTGGAGDGFSGALYEVLTESRGACDGCLPLVPAADPPVRACAARYKLTGTPR